MCDGNWHILCWNLSIPDEEVPLAPGIVLKQLSASLSVFDLAGLGAVGFREWGMLEPYLAKATTEIISAKDSDVTPGFDTLNRAWLASALLSLRGYSGHLPLACCNQSWDRAREIRKQVSDGVLSEIRQEPRDKGQEQHRIHCQILELHRKLIVNESCKDSEVSSEDADWVFANFDTFNLLCSESERFRFSLTAAFDWRFSKDLRTAISRLWAGIESILELRTETVYRVSTIAASLLKPRGAERVRFYKKIKKLYDVRSKAVHGGRVSDEKMVQALDDSYLILSRILVLCIEEKRVLTDNDFETALLGP